MKSGTTSRAWASTATLVVGLWLGVISLHVGWHLLLNGSGAFFASSRQWYWSFWFSERRHAPVIHWLLDFFLPNVVGALLFQTLYRKPRCFAPLMFSGLMTVSVLLLRGVYPTIVLDAPRNLPTQSYISLSGLLIAFFPFATCAAITTRPFRAAMDREAEVGRNDWMSTVIRRAQTIHIILPVGPTRGEDEVAATLTSRHPALKPLKTALLEWVREARERVGEMTTPDAEPVAIEYILQLVDPNEHETIVRLGSPPSPYRKTRDPSSRHAKLIALVDRTIRPA